MTSEKAVKSLYPKARVDVYKNRDKTRHWICWTDLQSRNPQRIGISDKSKNGAWVDARKYLDNKFKP